MLPVAQSRAASRRTQAFRRVVHGIAPRTVPHAQEPQEGRTAPPADWKNFVEGEPPGGLELGTGLELRECERNQPPASIRRGLSQHWMRALHCISGGSQQSEIRAVGRNQARMRHSHFFEASRGMSFFLGFLIAVAVGLTGVGGGSFTVPALVLIVGLTAGEAVGTAFVFAGVLRLIAAPFYLLGKHFHARYLWLLLLGAIPGLLLGTFFLRLVGEEGGNPVVIILLGIMLAASSSVTFAPRVQNPGFARKNSRWLPWLALPIGVESGFSSAGAGALGTVLLLNYSEMTPPQVIGTDLIFGLVLAVIGGAFHWKFGSISMPVLFQLLQGGVPGVVFGCLLARRVPANKLKMAVAMVAIFAGLQLVWTGSRMLAARHATNVAKITASAGTGHAR